MSADATFARGWEQTQRDDVIAAVPHVPLFAKLGRREVRRVARQAQLATLEAGDALDVSTGFFYVVLRGSADLCAEGLVRRLRPGDYFGETALLDVPSGPAIVVATDELQIMRLPKSAFMRLAERNASVAFAILRHVGNQIPHAA